MKYCVLDYIRPGDPTSLNRVFDMVENGDQIYFPSVVKDMTPYTAPPGGWQIANSVQIWGDGPGPDGTDDGTILEPGDASSPVFNIVTPAANITIRNMRLRGPGSGTGVGVKCHGTTSNLVPHDVRFERLLVTGFGSHGIDVRGYDTTTGKLIGLSVIDCIFRDCGGAGFNLLGVSDAYLLASLFEGNQMSGLTATECGIALYGCMFDGNSLLASLQANDGNLKLDQCPIATVDSCSFENFHLGSVKKGVVLSDCAGGTVRGGEFSTTSAGSGAHGIYVTGGSGTSGPVAVVANRFKDVSTLVHVDPAARDCVVLALYEESGNGALSLPASPNNGLFASPQVIRPNGGSGLTGLVVPSANTNPNANLQPGVLAYNRQAKQLRAFVGGFWKDVLLEP